VLTGSWDGTARLWDAAPGETHRILYGHLKGVVGFSAVALSKDSRWIVTGGDQTLKVWDTDTGVGTLVSFRDGTRVAVDRAGRIDASNDGDVEGPHWVVGNPRSRSHS
jgi:WD40 repeat protein